MSTELIIKKNLHLYLFQEPESNVFSSKNDPEKPPSPKRLRQADELGDGRDARVINH